MLAGGKVRGLGAGNEDKAVLRLETGVVARRRWGKAEGAGGVVSAVMRQQGRQGEWALVRRC